MKIGIFLPNATFDLPGTPEVGGIETFAFTIGEALQSLGHHVILYGGKPKPGKQHRPTSITLKLYDYIETHHIPDLGTRFQRLIQRLHFGWISRKDWLNEKFDLILIAKPFDWPLAYYWKRKAQKQGIHPLPKIIMGFQGEDYFFKCEAFYHAIDAAFAVSPEIAKRAQSRTHHAPQIIPNPVDTAFFKPIQPSVSQSFTIAASGRIIGWKGYHHLVNAIAHLRQNGHNVQLSIAGDGPELPKLKSLVTSLNLDHAVQFHGKLNPEALRNLLQKSTLYVQPSIGIEAFSISALEAASCGLPLVLSDQVGLSHFLDAQDYLSYPAQETNALAQAITTALHRQDCDWWDAQARHQRIHAQFSPQVVASQIIKLAFPETQAKP